MKQVLVLILFTAHPNVALPDDVFADSSSTMVERESDFSKQLANMGIESGEEGLRRYLRSFLPSKYSKERVLGLISQLGSDQFQVRTHATQELALISQGELYLVRQAMEDEDLEIRQRARQIVDMFEKGTHLKKLQRVLDLMIQHKAKGYAADLGAVYQVVQPEHYLHQKFSAALVMTVTENDLGYLRKRLNDETAFGRELFLKTLVALKPKEIQAELAEIAMGDSDEKLRLEAAVGLARIPDRRCLQCLVSLLQSDQVQVRSRASLTLRVVTGKRLGFVAVANAESRTAAAEKWQIWVNESGAEATLFLTPTKAIFVNRLILSSYTTKKVYELEMNGEVIRSLPKPGSPMGVFGTADGRILVCDYSGKTVRVFDESNKIILEKKLSAAPLSGQLLDNGNILVSISNAKKVLELDIEGNTVWEVGTKGRINSISRTPDDTTLVSMLGDNRVVEIDQTGKTIFELEVDKPNGIQRLDNGNTLICLYGKGEVREYDSTKNVIWKAIGITNPAQAQRLPSGETIVYHSRGVDFFGEDGKKTRTLDLKDLKLGFIGSLHFF